MIVSIRAPREGGDLKTNALHPKTNVSIRAPREGGDFFDALDVKDALVSIRAPREGGDPSGAATNRALAGFQSAPPVKGATNA